MQLRDYPHPLLDITETTITGRMMFAEQEAQERGRNAVPIWLYNTFCSIIDNLL